MTAGFLQETDDGAGRILATGGLKDPAQPQSSKQEGETKCEEEDGVWLG